MVGPPVTGKSMFAKRIPPPRIMLGMTKDAAIEISAAPKLGLSESSM